MLGVMRHTPCLYRNEPVCNLTPETAKSANGKSGGRIQVAQNWTMNSPSHFLMTAALRQALPRFPWFEVPFSSVLWRRTWLSTC